MKITEINKLYHPWVGGVETHVKDIAEGINQSFDVNVICCNSQKKTVTSTINGIKITKYSSWGILFSQPISLSLIKHLKNHGADILHFHLPNPWGVLAYFLARPKGKILITWHSDIIKQKTILFFYKPLLYWFLKTAEKIIVTSPNMAKNSPFLKTFQSKIKVIPLGIDPKEYQIKPFKKKHERFALFVGRLTYYKGVIELIEALKKSDIKLIMIGEGPLKPHIKKSAQMLIQKKQLILLPFQKKDTLNKYFNHCEFFILPSTHASEAFGIVQLEAMIYEKPVISTNLPTGVPFVNQHRNTGLIVEPGNIDDLVQAMNVLWNNHNLRRIYGENAKKRCLELFTKNQMISSTIECLNSIIKKKDV